MPVRAKLSKIDRSQTFIILGTIMFSFMSLAGSYNTTTLQNAILDLQKSNDDCTAFYTMPIYRDGNLTGLNWKDFRSIATNQKNFSLSSKMEGRDLREMYGEENKSWIKFYKSGKSIILDRPKHTSYLKKRLGVDIAIKCKEQRLEAQRSLQNYIPHIENILFLAGLLFSLFGIIERSEHSTTEKTS